MLESSLKRLNWSKAELGRRLGVTADQVSRWKNDPPQYATAYIGLALDLAMIRDYTASLDKTPR